MTKLPILPIFAAILIQIQYGQGVFNPNWAMKRVGTLSRPLLSSTSSSSFSSSIPSQSREYPSSKTVAINDPFDIIKRQKAEMEAQISEALGSDFGTLTRDPPLHSQGSFPMTQVTTSSPAQLEALAADFMHRTNALRDKLQHMSSFGGPRRVVASVPIEDHPPKTESDSNLPTANETRPPTKPYSSPSPTLAPVPTPSHSPSEYSSPSPVPSPAPYSPSPQPATCSASSTKPKRPVRNSSSRKKEPDYDDPKKGSLPPPPPRRFNSFGTRHGNASNTERFQGSTIVSEELPNKSGTIKIEISGNQIDDERMLQLIKEAKNAVTAVFYAPLYSAKVEGTISSSQRPQWSIF